MNAQLPLSRTTQLMDGIILGESPRWHDGKLWFADWVGEKLYTLDDTAHHEVAAEIASLPFSIDWLPDGRLLVVNARTNRLEVQAPDGSFTTFADLSGLSEFGCNEVVVAPDGNIYVNNINFDFPEGEFRPGFIALVGPDGTSRDGSLANARLWAKLDGQGADGICMDAEGCVWASSGPHCVRVKEGGEVLDEVVVDRMCFAVMLGGTDGKTLYIVANEWTGSINVETPTGRIYSARVDVPHAGYP